MTATPLTTADFRHALAQFATGVTVITASRASGPGPSETPALPYGMTANSFTSVSLDPFLTLVCVDQRSHLLPLVRQNRLFGVNVLQENQQAVSIYFAQAEQTPDAEAKLGIRYRWTPAGVPPSKAVSPKSCAGSWPPTSPVTTLFFWVKCKAPIFFPASRCSSSAATTAN